MPNFKPVVIHKGNTFTGEAKRERARAEQAYMVGRLRLVPPDELSERAKDKFNQIVSEAFWLDELSGDLLAAYCVAWDKWLGVVEAMDGTDEVLLYINSKGETVSRQNPLRRALVTYVEMMSILSGKLGLGNIDRLKLALPVAEKEKNNDPFADFMEKVE